MTSEKPWLHEPDDLDFEADGLPCAMRRGRGGAWCGYVGVPPTHPLHGLPTNHPLKLPMSWFERRRGFEGVGVFDLFLHAIEGKPLDESCAISMALQVHGGITFADHGRTLRDGYWWFGFDCSHAGDYMPGLDPAGFISRMIDTMPENLRGKMREIMESETRVAVYRDQQYVVSECQSLAAQLNDIEKLLNSVGENANASANGKSTGR